MSTFRSALRVAWRHPVYLVSYLAIVSLMGVLVGRLVADQAAAVPSSYEPVRASVAVVDEDGSVVFYHHWLRLCRRIVRDYKFRGSDAEFTLKMWPNVRRGEKLYISPYKENADLKFDSSLATEVCVMKPYVVPLLQELPRGEYPEADAILAAYERIETLDESLIPADSLIREFIGGGSFSY